jgi:hypothetical protein
MSNQAYGFKDTRFAKHNDIADIYNQFLERADQMGDSDDEEDRRRDHVGQGTFDYESALDQTDQGHI